jgi:hypothetical protein
MGLQNVHRLYEPQSGSYASVDPLRPGLMFRGIDTGMTCPQSPVQRL